MPLTQHLSTSTLLMGFTAISCCCMRVVLRYWEFEGRYVRHVIGGQTSHACGLVELGVCSDEVWQLNVTWAAGQVLVDWSATPIFHLPFGPRCHMAAVLAPSANNGWVGYFQQLFILGGQLSYNDSTCASPPITVNDVWTVGLYQNATMITDWTRQADAPFSPRRLDVSCNVASLSVQPQPCYLAGGIRYTNVTRVGEGQARLLQAELSADVWGCFVNTSTPLPWRCSWSQYDDEGATTFGSSLPSPSAGGVDSMDVLSPFQGPDSYENIAFGGWRPPSFLQRWSRTRPLLDDDAVPEEYDWSEVAFNVTMVRDGRRDDRNRTVAQLMANRAGLPLTAVLSEEELNDEAGVYVMGSEWTSIATPPQLDVDGVMVSTLHHQPTAFASHPNQSTVYVPQAASSLNTSRPHLNFPLRRHSHRHATLIPLQLIKTGAGSGILFRVFNTYHTGGQSGSRFYNDVMLTVKPRCLPPIDPSFRNALGPIVLVDASSLFKRWLFGGSFATTTESSSIAATVACAVGYHFEPPSLDSQRLIMCAPNGMWMEGSSLTILRCVKDQLHCAYPLADLGGLWCEPALPLITEIRATYPDDSSTPQPVPSMDLVTLVDVPLIAGVSLSIYGNAFFQPLRVLVGNDECASPQLRDTAEVAVSQVGYNISFDMQQHGLWSNSSSTLYPPQLIVGVYGQLIVCRLPLLLGTGMRVWLSSGRIGEVTEVDASISRTEATLSSLSPVLTRVQAVGECEQSEGQPLVLSSCPVHSSFNVTVCGSRESMGSVAEMYGVSVMLGTAVFTLPLSCSSIDPIITPEEVCMHDCMVYPGLSQQRLFLQRTALGLVSQYAALVSFRQCEAGTRVDYAAASRGNAGDLCVVCPPGSSTDGVAGASTCTPCAAGYATNVTSSARCSACPAGTYASSTNSTQCLRCPTNSYSNATAQSGCQSCALQTYVVYDALDDGCRVTGDCRPCPAQADCSPAGRVEAGAGSYLLIEQQAGTAWSVPCSDRACRQAHDCPMSTPPASVQSIGISQLHVSNCCDDGRWPAYLDNEQLYAHLSAAMQRDHGHNVLCAQCLPHYSQVNGRCIACSATNWPALLGLLALALLAVYLIHRLPHDWTGSATLLITSNFLQLSTLFLQSESMPQLLSLLNLNLLGDHVAKGQSLAQFDDKGAGYASYAGSCIVPLDDSGRLVVALVSPLMAMALLALLLALQLCLRCLLPARVVQAEDEGVGVDVAGDEREQRCRRAYRWLCVPASPLLRHRTSAARLAAPLMAQSFTADAEAAEPALRPAFSPASSATVPALSAPSLRLGYVRTMVRLLQLSYTSLTVVTLAFFHLQDVGEFGQRVVDYPTLSPVSAEYSSLLPVMVCVLVVVVCGWPVSLLLWLWYETRRGTTIIAQLPHWTASSRDEPVEDEVEAEDEQASPAAPTLVLAAAPLSTRAAILTQLTVMYRPGCWWMASLSLLRRLLCILLLTVVRSSAVWGWLSVLNTALLALHMQQQPYERARDNLLESAALLSLSLQTSLLGLYPPPYLSAALLATFNALVITPLLPPLLTTLQRVWALCRGAGARRR